ncbi:MAG: NADH-quinone oxidoreductase subunit M [Coriobacteriia bacterium]|nr:NADH-quinone oxidoreductase subunit M [Coriobacteriia bacterium]
MLPLLTIIVFLPLLGAAITALLPKERADLPRLVSLVVSLVDLALVAWLVLRFDVAGGLQFVERANWIPEAGIQYFLGIDGISLPLLFLSALLLPISILVSWEVSERPGFYFTMILLLAVGMNGVFVALDFVLFYVFWEIVLVPMYFLIAIWGGSRREYAAIKFFLYTLFGSVFVLVGILALYLHPGGGTFDMTVLAASTGLPTSFQWWVFAAFFLGFAVKVPVFPFHTWLPDAHVEAPTAGSVLLAGILLKMGTYGFVRVSLPMLPDAAASWAGFVALLGVVSIVYGAAVAFAQTDLKKLVAYSSVSHMGFVMLGIAAGTPEGLNGAVALMFAHGVITGMLFLLVGMVHERTHTRTIAEVSGLSKQVPVAGGMLAFASFASLGLPGLAGFVGEFLSLVGAWRSELVAPGYAIVAAAGILLAAAYMLWMVQRVVLGTPSSAVEGITDLTRLEIGILIPLVVITVVMGVYWSSILRYVDPAVTALLASMGAV